MLDDIRQKQFEDMVKEDKLKPWEIIKFFKDSYNIDIQPSKISHFRKSLGIKGKRGRQKKETAKIDEKDIRKDADAEIADLNTIIEETRQATKDVFLGIRLKLIESRNEVFKMKKGLGL